MAKQIKFNLVIDGNKVSTFEEMQDNLSAELLPHLSTGKLAKWFLSRDMADKAAAVQAIDSTQSDLAQLSALCEVLELEADDDILADILAMPEQLAQAQAVQAKENTKEPEEEVASSKSTYRLDFSSKDFSGRSFEGVDLSDANLENINLTDANLMGANLSGANLKNAILKDANLIGANLSGANLQGAVITGANFFFADLSKSNFKNVMGDESVFGGCICNKTDFSDSSLINSNFTNAHLINAYFLNSNLNGSQFITEKLDEKDYADFNKILKIIKINKDVINNRCSCLNTDFSFSNLSDCKFKDVDNMDTSIFTGVLGFSRYELLDINEKPQSVTPISHNS